MAHGQEDTTEIIGTEGKLTINGNPQQNLVNYYHAGGITREVPVSYWGRFEMAFVKEFYEFAAACLDVWMTLYCRLSSVMRSRRSRLVFICRKLLSVENRFILMKLGGEWRKRNYNLVIEGGGLFLAHHS